MTDVYITVFNALIQTVIHIRSMGTLYVGKCGTVFAFLKCTV